MEVVVGGAGAGSFLAPALAPVEGMEGTALALWASSNAAPTVVVGVALTPAAEVELGEGFGCQAGMVAGVDEEVEGAGVDDLVVPPE